MTDSRAGGNLWRNNHVVEEGNPPSHKILVLRQYKARHVCTAHNHLVKKLSKDHVHVPTLPYDMAITAYNAYIESRLSHALMVDRAHETFAMTVEVPQTIKGEAQNWLYLPDALSFGNGKSDGHLLKSLWPLLYQDRGRH